MLEILSTYLEPILTFIMGGGFVGLLKWRSIKKHAEADAMKAVQDVYQETIKDLRTDKDAMRADNLELREELNRLQETVKKHAQDIRSLKRDRCVVKDCKLRKRE